MLLSYLCELDRWRHMQWFQSRRLQGVGERTAAPCGELSAVDPQPDDAIARAQRSTRMSHGRWDR